MWLALEVALGIVLAAFFLKNYQRIAYSVRPLAKWLIIGAVGWAIVLGGFVLMGGQLR